MQVTNSSDRDVAVIGCGLMGSAIARRLAETGFSVAVWNRNPERAVALAGDRILPVGEITDAVASTDLVIACTTNYETTGAALEPVEDWGGTTVVNLATGTAREAEKMNRDLTGRGARYLDGVISCYPRQIGATRSLLAYAGPRAAWERHRDLLMTLGGASYHLSEEVPFANLAFIGVAGFFITSVCAFVEAANYAKGAGVPAAAMAPIVASFVDLVRDDCEEVSRRIEHGDFETDQATIEIHADGLRAALDALRAASSSAPIMEAAAASLEAAIRDGRGGLDIAAQAGDG